MGCYFFSTAHLVWQNYSRGDADDLRKNMRFHLPIIRNDDIVVVCFLLVRGHFVKVSLPSHSHLSACRDYHKISENPYATDYFFKKSENGENKCQD